MKVLHANATRNAYSAARTLLLLVCLSSFLHRDLTVFSELPLNVVRQVGLNALIPFSVWQRILSSGLALQTIQWTGIVAILVALLGFGRAMALTWTAMVLIFQEGIIVSRGVLSHNHTAPLYLLCTLTLFEWIDRYRKPQNPENDTFSATALFTLAIVFTFTYSFIGIRRLAYGGPALLFSDTPGYWLVSRGYTGIMENPDYAWTHHVPDWPWIVLAFKAGLAITTILEVTAPLVLVSRTYRCLFLPAVFMFHLLTFVSMNITFWQNVSLLPLLCDFGAWVSPRTAIAGKNPIVYFDGVCNLCNRAVALLLRWDRKRILRFASLQGETARERIGESDGAPETWSMLYEDEAGLHDRSTAALRIVNRLGWPYMIAALGLLVPRPVRDAVYRVVARNRYRWFGKRDTCRIPTPEERSVFLD
jgi:predicted DCC family thiol-disulfide oxidoreductase YuxK